MPKNAEVWLRTLIAATFVALGTTVSAQTEQEIVEIPAIDPRVLEVLESATTFLSEQDVLSVDWFVSYDEVIDGREKITRTRSGSNLLDRSQGFYAYAENGTDSREYFFDGVSFQIFDVEENAYVLAPFNGDFEVLVDRAKAEYDVVLPIWSILTRQSRNELLSNAESAAYMGLTRVVGREAHHLALSNYDKDWQVWISSDAERPELLMLVGTDPYTQGWPQYRVFFSNWNFDPEIEEGAFTFVPDEDAERMSWPKVRQQVDDNPPAIDAEDK